MSLLTWNCIELGNLTVVQNLRLLIRHHIPNVDFLSETKLFYSEAMPLKARVNYHNGVIVESEGRRGGQLNASMKK